MKNHTSSVSEIITNTKYTNTSDSVNLKNTNTNHKPQTKTLTQVRLIADKLSTALNNTSRFEYYCKVAWRLPEAQIWNNLEQSAKGRDQVKLFTWLCQQDLGK